jgi:hypothetical protein
MRVALAFAAVAILCVDAFSPSAPSLRSVPKTSTIRMRGEAGSGFERRDALRVLVGGTAAAVAGSFAGSVVEAPLGDLSAGIPANQWERYVPHPFPPDKAGEKCRSHNMGISSSVSDVSRSLP